MSKRGIVLNSGREGQHILRVGYPEGFAADAYVDAYADDLVRNKKLGKEGIVADTKGGLRLKEEDRINWIAEKTTKA